MKSFYQLITISTLAVLFLSFVLIDIYSINIIKLLNMQKMTY